MKRRSSSRRHRHCVSSCLSLYVRFRDGFAVLHFGPVQGTQIVSLSVSILWEVSKRQTAFWRRTMASKRLLLNACGKSPCIENRSHPGCLGFPYRNSGYKPCDNPCQDSVQLLRERALANRSISSRVWINPSKPSQSGSSGTYSQCLREAGISASTSSWVKSASAAKRCLYNW